MQMMYYKNDHGHDLGKINKRPASIKCPSGSHRGFMAKLKVLLPPSPVGLLCDPGLTYDT